MPHERSGLQAAPSSATAILWPSALQQLIVWHIANLFLVSENHFKSYPHRNLVSPWGYPRHTTNCSKIRLEITVISGQYDILLSHASNITTFYDGNYGIQSVGLCLNPAIEQPQEG
jgi:hypothetical protein